MLLNIPSQPFSAHDPPTRRNNMDKSIKGDHQELLDFCMSNELYILNGRSLGDPFGTKTFYGQRSNSYPDCIAVPETPTISVD